MRTNACASRTTSARAGERFTDAGAVGARCGLVVPGAAVFVGAGATAGTGAGFVGGGGVATVGFAASGARAGCAVGAVTSSGAAVTAALAYTGISALALFSPHPVQTTKLINPALKARTGIKVFINVRLFLAA